MGTSSSQDLTNAPADDRLVQAALLGRRDAAETLVRRHLHRVYALARRILANNHDAEDATQETMVRAIRALPDYRSQGTFDRWLLKIAANTCLTILRARRRTAALEPLDQRYPAPAPDPSGEINADRLAAIDRLLPCLPDRHRAAFILFHYESFSIRQVADVLEIPEPTVRTSLHRARARLRDMITLAEKGCPQ